MKPLFDAVAIILSISLFFNVAIAGEKPERIDGIAALVNDEVITDSEVNQELERITLELKGKGLPLPRNSELRRQVINQLVDKRLQLQLARQIGIKVDDETLNQAIEKIAEINKLSVPDFKEVLKDEGMTFKQFRNRIRSEITLRRLRQQQIVSQILITDQDVDNFLIKLRRQGQATDEYHIAHILVPIPEAAGEDIIRQARAQAEDIYHRLTNGGEDFARLAISSSRGEQALEGGDLGWRKLGELPSLFADQVIEMKPGSISSPLRSSRGFHLIKLLDHRSGEQHMITQTLARHILIKPNALVDDAQTRSRVMALRKQIVAGKRTFEAVALTESEDKVSASKGGDLGWVDPGIMVPEFEKAMNELEKGALSQPIRTPFGWHLIQVLDRRTIDKTLEFNRAQAREQLHRREAERNFDSWLRQRRGEAYIEIRNQDANTL